MEDGIDFKVIKEKIIKTDHVLQLYSKLKKKNEELKSNLELSNKKKKQLSNDITVIKLENERKYHQYEEQKKEYDMIKSEIEKRNCELSCTINERDKFLNELQNLQNKYQTACSELSNKEDLCKKYEYRFGSLIMSRKKGKGKNAPNEIDDSNKNNCDLSTNETSSSDIESKPVKIELKEQLLIDQKLKRSIWSLSRKTKAKNEEEIKIMEMTTEIQELKVLNENLKEELDKANKKLTFNDEEWREKVECMSRDWSGMRKQLELEVSELKKTIANYKISDENKETVEIDYKMRKKLESEIEELKKIILNYEKINKRDILEEFKIDEKMESNSEEKAGNTDNINKIDNGAKQFGINDEKDPGSQENKVNFKEDMGELPDLFYPCSDLSDDSEGENRNLKSEKEINISAKTSIFDPKVDENEKNQAEEIQQSKVSIFDAVGDEITEKEPISIEIKVDSEIQRKSSVPISEKDDFIEESLDNKCSFDGEKSASNVPPKISEVLEKDYSDSEFDCLSVAEIFKEMAMISVMSPFSSSEEDPLPLKETNIPDQLSILNETTEITAPTIFLKPKDTDKFKRIRELKEKKLSSLLAIKKAKTKLWLKKSRTILGGSQNRKLIKQTNVKTQTIKPTTKDKDNGQDIVEILADLVSQRLKSNVKYYKRRSLLEDPRGVLEVNKMLLEKARRTNHGWEEAVSDYPEKSNEEEGKNCKKDRNVYVISEASSSELELPIFDSCYESQLSNPPSIEMVHHNQESKESNANGEPKGPTKGAQQKGPDENKSNDVEINPSILNCDESNNKSFGGEEKSDNKTPIFEVKSKEIDNDYLISEENSSNSIHIENDSFPVVGDESLEDILKIIENENVDVENKVDTKCRNDNIVILENTLIQSSTTAMSNSENSSDDSKIVENSKSPRDLEAFGDEIRKTDEICYGSKENSVETDEILDGNRENSPKIELEKDESTKQTDEFLPNSPKENEDNDKSNVEISNREKRSENSSLISDEFSGNVSKNEEFSREKTHDSKSYAFNIFSSFDEDSEPENSLDDDDKCRKSGKIDQENSNFSESKSKNKANERMWYKYAQGDLLEFRASRGLSSNYFEEVSSIYPLISSDESSNNTIDFPSKISDLESSKKEAVEESSNSLKDEPVISKSTDDDGLETETLRDQIEIDDESDKLDLSSPSSSLQNEGCVNSDICETKDSPNSIKTCYDSSENLREEADLRNYNESKSNLSNLDKNETSVMESTDVESLVRSVYTEGGKNYSGLHIGNNSKKSDRPVVQRQDSSNLKRQRSICREKTATGVPKTKKIKSKGALMRRSIRIYRQKNLASNISVQNSENENLMGPPETKGYENEGNELSTSFAQLELRKSNVVEKTYPNLEKERAKDRRNKPSENLKGPVEMKGNEKKGNEPSTSFAQLELRKSNMMEKNDASLEKKSAKDRRNEPSTSKGEYSANISEKRTNLDCEETYTIPSKKKRISLIVKKKKEVGDSIGSNLSKKSLHDEEKHPSMMKCEEDNEDSKKFSLEANDLPGTIRKSTGFLVEETERKKIVIKAKEARIGGFKRPNNTKIIPACPQSPPMKTSVDVSELQTEPVIIPLEKPIPMEATKAETFFHKLITYSSEEKTVEEIAKHFRNQDVSHIVELILKQIVQDKEKASSKSPHCPMMTDTQRVMFGFMIKLEQSNVENLIETYLKSSELRLIHSTSLEEVLSITRMYVAVCKYQKCIERVRRMCCDSFYFMRDLAIPFFFVVLTSWIEILPMEDKSNDFPIVKLLVQLVNLKSCNFPGHNLLPLRELLHKYYGYPKEPWNVNDFFKELFDNYLKNPVRPNDFMVLLYCKNNSCKWTCEKVESLLRPIVDSIKNENFKATVIILICNIISQFEPNLENQKHLLPIREWLRSLTDGDDVPSIIVNSVALGLRRIKKPIVKKNKSTVNKIPEEQTKCS